ncbi:MAG: PEP-CTERM sorting domain-containing protein [Syntrophobacterales bacterium]|nr:PEP-CTERM sorting domain-containing protein [Syntrophobacterales bacterium]
MKRLMVIIAAALFILSANYEASAWIYLPDYGDTGWQTYTYTAPQAFSGTAGFVVSNAIDSAAYSELLLDNLSQGGGETNRGFELGNFSGYVLMGASYAEVSTWKMSDAGNLYYPTMGEFFSDQLGLTPGIDTSGFYNGSGQAGTIGSIMETPVALSTGAQFSFDWAFLANDSYNDFALFYLKDNYGNIVFSDGLAQVGSPAPVPLPSSLLLFASGILGLLGLKRNSQ